MSGGHSMPGAFPDFLFVIPCRSIMDFKNRRKLPGPLDRTLSIRLPAVQQRAGTQMVCRQRLQRNNKIFWAAFSGRWPGIAIMKSQLISLTKDLKSYISS
jgi:hypothetical protein